MSQIDEAKLVSLKDKHLAIAAQVEEEAAKLDEKEKKGKGRRIKSKSKK